MQISEALKICGFVAQNFANLKPLRCNCFAIKSAANRILSKFYRRRQFLQLFIAKK
jgi:hypothetical protein